MSKFETLDSLIEKVGFDKILKEGSNHMCKITLTLGEFTIMIHTPKEEAEVYSVSIFENRDTLFQEWFYNPTFIYQVKEFIEQYKNK